MSIIQWDESLSVKVKEIDAQHQKLINLLNELFDAMRVGKVNPHRIEQFIEEVDQLPQ